MRTLTFLILAASSVGSVFAAEPSIPVPTMINLSRGPFPLYTYPLKSHLKGVVLLASGDGGWKPWENRLASTWAEESYAVVGWDCLAYAKNPYSATNLQQDLEMTLKWAVRRESVLQKLPIILAGYSTGAEQETAAMASAGLKSKVVGMLLIAPGKRGRYDIRLSDLMGLTPKGSNTFALADFASALSGIRLAQIHGEHDPLDSTSLYDAYSGTKRKWIYLGGWHRFGGVDAVFQKMTLEALSWILNEKQQ